MTIIVKGQRRTTRGFCFYKRADNTDTHMLIFYRHVLPTQVCFKTNQKCGCTTASYLYMPMEKPRGIQQCATAMAWKFTQATDNYYKQHFQKGIVLVTMMSCICV